MAKVPISPPYKTYNCVLHNNEKLPIYQWVKDESTNQHCQSVLIVHDLWENLTFYQNDIKWFLDQDYKVYGINATYDGCNQDYHYAQNFDRLCINLLQVLSTIHKLDDLNAPIIYTKGSGAIITLKLARRYQRFIRAMICYCPMLELRNYPKDSYLILLKVIATLFPNLILPSLVVPHIVEFYDNQVSSEKSTKKAISSLSVDSSCRRISSKALYDYLTVIKKARSICANNILPSLFIYNSKSKILDDQLINELSKNDQLVDNFSSENLDLERMVSWQNDYLYFKNLAEKTISPWLEQL